MSLKPTIMLKSFPLILAMTLFPFMTSAQSYDALWKAEQKQVADGKPQSAYATMQKILQKAVAEGQQGQALSARLCAAGLHQEWAPDSFFTDIAELETLRAQEQHPEARAIYASILAEIYQNNRYRSQARDLTLTSNEMKEWTTEQYDSAATANWRLSLEDIEVLANARSKDWLPFVTQATHSSYYHHDLLHILWQRYHESRTTRWSQTSPARTALGAAVCDLYRRLGNREAALLVELSITANEVAPLQALKEEFVDLPLCAEVYLRLLDTDANEAQKVAWCREAISRYPHYARIGEVKNRLNDLCRPQVNWTGNDIYYPGKRYSWRLSTRNATAVVMTIYRLQKAFTDEDIERSKLSVAEYLRRNGTEMQKINHSIKPTDAFTFTEDTLGWTAPAAGIYAVLYGGVTAEKEAKQRTVTSQYRLFRVTTLKTLTRYLPQDKLEVIVVDAESGQPVPGAIVELYENPYRTGQEALRASYKTDAEGRALCTATKDNGHRWQLNLRVRTSADTYLPEENLFRNSVSFRDTPETTQLHLYTDRAIYRPGQTVHVSGVVYAQQRWDATVVGGQGYELLMRDANWKEVGKQQVTTDSMGVFAADFALPAGGLPGYYRIQTQGASVGFRVEEYKRPTFEVTMDEAPALQWPQDSITLTGKAVGYNGVPVRDARVTGSFRFTYPYWWWFRHDDSPRQQIDTLSTDDEGRFRVHVPLKELSPECLRYGLVLRVEVEVLSSAGETREGAARVPLCTTPLRLNITMQEQQNRDRLQAPTFTLLSSTGHPTTGDIRCAIYPATFSPNVPSGSPASATSSRPVSGGPSTGASAPIVADIAPSGLLDALRTLPSGSYELRTTAHSGADTASAKASFYLFSMADTRLPRQAESWLYTPTDTFDLQHPARLQVGSSFEDVALYYSLVGKEGIIKNELLRISDELRIIEIPYLSEYGDGVTAHFAFVKGGKSYIMSQTLKRSMPDKQLRYEWTTFRDHLHPGDKETWTLRLTTPDGAPASANLMATLYDASLDQLTPHSWTLLVNRYHRVPTLPWRSHDFFQPYNAHELLYFPMKDYHADALVFDTFDSRWLDALSFRGNAYGIRRVGATMRLRGTKAVEEVTLTSTAHDTAEFAAAPMAMAKVDAGSNQALNGTIAGLTLHEEIAEDEAEGEEETLGATPVALRTNFNETAFFLPRLHSDPATGDVSLSFTLPESLTTWQLLGIAHTRDMMTANLQAQTIARKELMASLYLPRFLRVGDQANVRAVVQNLTDEALSGKALLEIFDPETEKVLLKHQAPFETAAHGEAVLAFDYTPTEVCPIVAVRLTAETSQFSDGEQRYLAILSSKEWITESVEIQADGAGTFTTDLSTLFNKDNPSATQRRLTVEYTTHPIWNVVQALPALREPQHDDVLSLTSVFYANALSAHIATTTPRLHDIIALWKQQSGSTQSAISSASAHAAQSALPSPVVGGSSANVSPLAGNEDLKQLILDETPWLHEANRDNERRAQLAGVQPNEAHRILADRHRADTPRHPHQRLLHATAGNRRTGQRAPQPCRRLHRPRECPPDSGDEKGRSQGRHHQHGYADAPPLHLYHPARRRRPHRQPADRRPLPPRPPERPGGRHGQRRTRHGRHRPEDRRPQQGGAALLRLHARTHDQHRRPRHLLRLRRWQLHADSA